MTLSPRAARCAATAATLAVLRIVPAWAQTSAITGRVLEEGRPVELAAIRAERSDGSVSREAVTAADGVFRLAPLTPHCFQKFVRRAG